MSDVSAVLLSTGEPSVGRARHAIEMQTLAACEIVDVENVTPFHRALNEGARRVTGDFFVQVDADMVLDPECFAELRYGVRADTGIVVGELRDPMMGQTVGVKLFRTECFASVETVDSVSPDTDFVDSISRRGWKTVYVGRQAGSMHATHTVGDHDPLYTPSYVMTKFLLEGARLRYRGARGGLRWRIRRLAQSDHELAPVALICVAHGFFSAAMHDGLVPAREHEHAIALVQLLESSKHLQSNTKELMQSVNGPRIGVIFERFVSAGREAASTDAGARVRAILTALRSGTDNWRTTVATVAFGHGVLGELTGELDVERDEMVIKEFLAFGIPVNASAMNRRVAQARYALNRIARFRATRW